MCFVYVLKSLKNGRLYTGSTNDLERRLQEHNNGLSKYTKLTAPFELVYTEEYKTKSEAYRREIFLKTGKGRQVLKEILKSRE
jgi:putative endonuclease